MEALNSLEVAKQRLARLIQEQEPVKAEIVAAKELIKTLEAETGANKCVAYHYSYRSGEWRRCRSTATDENGFCGNCRMRRSDNRRTEPHRGPWPEIYGPFRLDRILKEAFGYLASEDDLTIEQAKIVNKAIEALPKPEFSYASLISSGMPRTKAQKALDVGSRDFQNIQWGIYRHIGDIEELAEVNRRIDERERRWREAAWRYQSPAPKRPPAPVSKAYEILPAMEAADLASLAERGELLIQVDSRSFKCPHVELQPMADGKVRVMFMDLEEVQA